jgi:hypothetical protein
MSTALDPRRKELTRFDLLQRARLHTHTEAREISYLFFVLFFVDGSRKGLFIYGRCAPDRLLQGWWQTFAVAVRLLHGLRTSKLEVEGTMNCGGSDPRPPSRKLQSGL